MFVGWHVVVTDAVNLGSNPGRVSLWKLPSVCAPALTLSHIAFRLPMTMKAGMKAAPKALSLYRPVPGQGIVLTADQQTRGCNSIDLLVSAF